MSLSRGLLLWLGVLVVTCLCSAFFVANHHPTRWVLVGFIASHLFVFGAPVMNRFTMRVGIMSLAHVVCWAPGWLQVSADSEGRCLDFAYGTWSYALIVVIAISFIFDVLDSYAYLRALTSGILP